MNNINTLSKKMSHKFHKNYR